MKILVVDDDELIRAIISQILQSEGHEIEEAGNGIDAINRLDTDTYDIVITDVVMPRLNGGAVAAHIKNTRIPTPVLLISGHSADADGNILGFASYFGDDFLQKPFEDDELLAAVDRLANRPYRWLTA